MERRYLVNPHRSDHGGVARPPVARPRVAQPPVARPRAFHERLPGYAPTPLIDARPLAAARGIGRLWVKDESTRLGLPAFKMLGASWATYRALVARLGAEPAWDDVAELSAALAPLRPLTLATATDGNHGRAVARMARLLDLDCSIYLPDGTARARIAAIEAEGARCTVLPGGTYEDAVDRVRADEGDWCLVVSDTSWPGYEDVPRWVVDGYATIFDEIDEALGAQGAPWPDAVVIQSGVGALAAAAVAAYRPGAPASTVAPAVAADRASGPAGSRRAGAHGGPWLLNVEPVDAACLLASVEAGERTLVPGPHRSIMAGLNCGLPSLAAFPVVLAGFDAFVSVTDDDARRGMRDLASVCIVSGESGAAGLAGLDVVLAHRDEWDVPLGPDSSVLVVSTEGATDPGAYRDVVGHDPVACARERAGGPRCAPGACVALAG